MSNPGNVKNTNGKDPILIYDLPGKTLWCQSDYYNFFFGGGGGGG